MRNWLIRRLGGQTKDDAFSRECLLVKQAMQSRDDFWSRKTRAMLLRFLGTKKYGHLAVTPVQEELKHYTLKELEEAK